jgi:8-oxo-dGTP pyrophosphatase MutT (NUDIX family)
MLYILKRAFFYLGLPYLALHMPIYKRARILVVADDYFLAARGPLGSKKWSTPGGGIKKNETAVEAATRELFEETGIIATSNELVSIGTFRGRFSKIVFSRYDLFILRLSHRPKTASTSHEKVESEWIKIKKTTTQPTFFTIDVHQALTELSSIKNVARTEPTR